jgi:ribosome-associated translation inhibitor RaiA
MNLQILTDNYHLTPKNKKIIDQKVGQKVDKLLSKFNQDLKTAYLHIKKRTTPDGGFRLSFDMSLPGKEHIFAQQIHQKFSTALINLRKQVEKQIKRYKADLKTN